MYEVFFRNMVPEGTSPFYNKFILLILCLKCRSRYPNEMAADLAHATGAETVARGFARTEWGGRERPSPGILVLVDQNPSRGSFCDAVLGDHAAGFVFNRTSFQPPGPISRRSLHKEEFSGYTTRVAIPLSKMPFYPAPLP